ncbi:MAG: nucleotidyltransferase family protein, partial [Methanobacterium sp.]
MDDDNERKIKSLVKLDLDWDYLLKIASRHNLKQLLYWQLNRIGSGEVPSEIMRDLKEFLKNNATKNLLFLKELISIIKLLNKHDIKSVPYKGPILAQQVYGNLTMRQFGDLDLLVKKDDVPIIKEVLISKGYKPEFDLDSIQEQNYLNSQRELKFYHENKRITLELHWKFSGIFLNLSSNAEKLFLNELSSIDMGGVSIPEISP